MHNFLIFKMSVIELFKNQVKEEPKFKATLDIEIKEFSKLNTASRASMSKRLFVEKRVVEEAMTIMGNAINEAEIEIDALEVKNKELEKELTEVDKARINKLYQSRKQELQNDPHANDRIMRRLNKTMYQSRSLMGYVEY